MTGAKLVPQRMPRPMGPRQYWLVTTLAVAALSGSPVVALIGAGQEMLEGTFFAMLAAALTLFALGLWALRATQDERLRRAGRAMVAMAPVRRPAAPGLNGTDTTDRGETA